MIYFNNQWFDGPPLDGVLVYLFQLILPLLSLLHIHFILLSLIVSHIDFLNPFVHSQLVYFLV